MPVNYWMHNNMITIDGKKKWAQISWELNLEQFFTGEHEN